MFDYIDFNACSCLLFIRFARAKKQKRFFFHKSFIELKVFKPRRQHLIHIARTKVNLSGGILLF